MSHCELASRPLLQCLRHTYGKSLPVASLQSSRSFQTTTVARDEVQAEPKKEPFYKAPDPALVTSPRLERQLLKSGISPIGSRRRRAALQTSLNIPFEHLPYQCFQEARKILLADREQKLQEIAKERDRIVRFRALSDEEAGGEQAKKSKLGSMEKHFERLKILADINDPVVKKRFEDGEGDMNKPIYRYLADRKWREYRRLILVQRITQMKVIPDVLAHCDPIVDIKLYFGGRSIQPGVFVDSRVSMTPPKLNIQSFERGEKLVTIAVMNPDIPNVETNGFDDRCHFLAMNVPISPTNTHVDLTKLSESQILFPWLPPAAQKGSPYHRLSVLILEQKDSQPLDVAAAKERRIVREGLHMRSLQAKFHLKAIGAHLFRNQWDENTAEVMRELGIVEDADIELRRKRVEPLPYKRRNPKSFR